MAGRGNQTMQALLRSGAIQAKLAVSQPGDPHEREADRVAEAVVQRKCACEGSREPCEECSGKGGLHRTPASCVAPPAAPRKVETALASNGQPLDAAVRADMESRFGRDFGTVRVHTDPRAAASAQEIHARAFTAGHRIVFGAGQYAPETPAGKRLLAHELTHVLQQGRDGEPRLQRDALDDEAEELQPLAENEESDDDDDDAEEEEESVGEEPAAGESEARTGNLMAQADPAASGGGPGAKRKGRSGGNPQIGKGGKCPQGYKNLGRFKLTAYVLAQESDFPAKPKDTDPCGLTGDFSHDFLFQTSKSPRGVKTQGSGRALDGSIIHYAPKGGNDCFEVISCPKTKKGTCATSGRTVAVDPSLIRLGSELLIEGVGSRVAEDTGGSINGAHIDVYYGTDITAAEALKRTFTGRTVCRKKVTGPVKKKKVKKP